MLWREQVTFDKIIVMSVLLSWISIVLAHWNKQPVDRHVAPLGHITAPTRLCLFSLMICAWRRSNKYQFYNHWSKWTESRTHEYVDLYIMTNMYQLNQKLLEGVPPFTPPKMELPWSDWRLRATTSLLVVWLVGAHYATLK